MNVHQVITLIKIMLGLKVRGKLTFNFDGSGGILPEFEIKGGGELLNKLNKAIKTM